MVLTIRLSSFLLFNRENFEAKAKERLTVKKDQRLFYSTSEDDDDGDLFDGSGKKPVDAKLNNADSVKTLVEETPDAGKPPKVETRTKVESDDLPEAVKVGRTLIDELAAKLGPSVVQNGFSSSTEDVRKSAKPDKHPVHQPMKAEQAVTVGKESPGRKRSDAKVVPKNKKSIFGSGSSSEEDTTASATTSEAPKPIIAPKLDPGKPGSGLSELVQQEKTKKLFDSDSDSDDLFKSSGTRPAKTAVTKSEPVKPVAAAAQTSSSQLSVKPTEKSSLFSSDDESDKVKTANARSANSVPSTKQKSSLFDDSSSDDDVDVLFKKAVAKSSPLISAKPTPVAKSLFEDSSDDDDDDADDDSKVFVATVKVTNKRSKSPSPPNPSVPQLGQEAKPEAPQSVPITNSASNDRSKMVDAKKLEFLSKASIIDPQNEESPQERILKESQPEVGQKVSDVDSDGDVADGNIFSAKKKDSKKFKDVLSEKLAKGPRPVGKAKTPTEVETVPKPGEADQTLDEPKQVIDPPQEPTKTEAANARGEPKVEPVVKIEPKLKTEERTPPEVEPERKLEDQTTTLDSLTKNRARLPTNRRPPTKKGLSPRADDQADSSKPLPEAETNGPVLDSKPEMAKVVPALDVVKEPKNTPSLPPPTLEKHDSSQPSLPNESAEVKGSSPNVAAAAVAITNKDSRMSKALEVPTSAANPNQEQIAKSESQAVEAAKSAASEDDDDDLFGPPPMPDVIKASRREDPLFGSSDDDDDLFGNTKNAAKTGTSSLSRGVFDDTDDDDDDLFASK